MSFADKTTSWGGGGDKGPGALEKRGREAGEERAGSWSSKRAEAGEKCETLFFLNSTMC